MVEHVGEERIDLYMRTLHDLLRPGGRLLNHGIAKLMDFDTKDEGAFSERFVFPDGVPLPLSRIAQAMERTGLVVRHVEGLPEDYARTLAYWIESYESRYDEAVRLAGAGARPGVEAVPAGRSGRLHHRLGVGLSGACVQGAG